MEAQIRRLAAQRSRYVELMEGLARSHGLYIVAGTIPVMQNDGGVVKNVCHVFGPSGRHDTHGKLHVTRFETEDWGVSPDSVLKVFETEFGRLAVSICYDVEFPEIARAAAREGANVLAVPSCTDDRQGFLRVRYCSQARAVENQMYVVQSSTVGSLPTVPAVSLNYGQAAIFTPSDFAFARDGILAEGIRNQETIVIAEMNLNTIVECRASGTVLPLEDSRRTAAIVARPMVVSL